MAAAHIADFRLDSGAAGPLLSWCPRTDLLAIQEEATSQNVQHIRIVHPDEPQVRFV